MKRFYDYFHSLEAESRFPIILAMIFMPMFFFSAVFQYFGFSHWLGTIWLPFLYGYFQFYDRKSAKK